MKKITVCLIIATIWLSVGCNLYDKSNNHTQLFYGLLFSDSPVLNALFIPATTPNSITLAQPTMATGGNPAPSLDAYIGPNGTISIIGTTVSGASEGPVDVSAGPYTFNLLASNTVYRVIVVAQNINGYSVQQIVTSTGGIAPVMNALVTTIPAPTLTTITLSQPTFSTAGFPAPMVGAYIGVNGFISIAGTTVSGAVQGPIDVSAGPHTFAGLTNNTTYRIIVVAQNSLGFSVRQALQSTTGIAPVMNALVTTTVPPTLTTITLDQPTFSTGGNPTPTVSAYIGVNGFISVLGTVVSGAIQGPIDVSAGPHTFIGLANNTTYQIIVVAQNSFGSSVQLAIQSTTGIAPVMNPLVANPGAPTTIDLNQPTLSTGGNPVPTVAAYIGLTGFISNAGPVVSGFTEGPINVSAAGYTFAGLTTGFSYTIIVVAQNSVGFSVQQTAPIIAP